MAERPVAIEEDRTAAIFRTAAEIFQRKGYHATAMGEIADAVDLTKAGLYYYVKGKEDLLFAIVSFAMDRLEAWVEAARACPGRSSACARSSPAMRSASRSTATRSRCWSTRPRRSRPSVVRGSVAASAPTTSSSATTWLSSGGGAKRARSQRRRVRHSRPVMWLARWYSRDGELGGEEVARQITTMALEGILIKPGTGGDAARREDIG